MSAPLPRWTNIVVGASFVPTCDLCGWIGKDQWSNTDARRACRDHARSKLHREDAEARDRAIHAERRRVAFDEDDR